MPLATRRAALLALLLVAALAGCTAEGASRTNFELEPQAIGWLVGDDAAFTLTLKPSLTRSEPSFTVDRTFAIEEVRFEEQGAAVGGDYRTRDPDDVSLRLLRDGHPLDEATLDADTPDVELRLVVPEDLRDSNYVLELKLFEVGWVKSAPFRIDRP